MKTNPHPRHQRRMKEAAVEFAKKMGYMDDKDSRILHHTQGQGSANNHNHRRRISCIPDVRDGERARHPIDTIGPIQGILHQKVQN